MLSTKIRFAHAVTLKFLPPTNTRGSRYRASFMGTTGDKGSVVWSREYHLEHADYVVKAVQFFIDHLNEDDGWSDHRWVCESATVSHDGDVDLIHVVTRLEKNNA